MMEYFLISICLSFLILSCSKPKSEILNESKKVIVAGKVVGKLANDSIVGFSVNRVGFDQELIKTTLDSTGYFHFEFEAFVPLDGWLSYQTNFLVAAHPGDSIYIEFDGKSEDRSEILEKIKFSGDAAGLNQQISEFQKRYFQSHLYSDEMDELKEKVIKEYEPAQFKLFSDSLRSEGQKLFNDFVNDIAPSNEVKTWSSAFIDQDFYSGLTFYPESHRKAWVKKQSEWDVPLSYYDFVLEAYPVSESLIGSGSVSRYSGSYVYRYIRENMKHSLKDFQSKAINVESIPLYVQDSISIQLIIKKTSDPLLKEISLTYFFHNLLNDSEIETFERNRKLIDEQITQPFLKQPLLKEYDELKISLQNIALNKEVQQLDGKMSGAQTAVEDVIERNKGKVIYIDIWATWCGPCREEFPYTKKLEEQFSNNVVFAFLCIESGEKAYLNLLKKFQLRGQHYFIDEIESKKISEKYTLRGIPHYMLIDKKGKIAFQGYKIKPSDNATTLKIKSLL
jgi:thiol-disulfide isomerase/thioredoxin